MEKLPHVLINSFKSLADPCPTHAQDRDSSTSQKTKTAQEEAPLPPATGKTDCKAGSIDLGKPEEQLLCPTQVPRSSGWEQR